MFHPLRQPGFVSLRGLIPSASFVGCADITVSAVTEHSQDCTPGCLFAALPGSKTHGREHVRHALLGGAAAILTDRPLADVSLPQCIVPDARQVYGRLCHGLYAFPSQRLGVAGVTGTNGKTTTTWIVRSLLESASHPTGVIGTIEYNDGMESRPARLTTPDALTIARTLAAMRDRHTSHAALELSSHALKQGRTAGLTLDVGIVTNVTHDHFDYHGNFHDYIRSKARISGHIKRGGLLALNADDPNSENILERLDNDVRVLMYGIDSPADLRAEQIVSGPDGSRFQMVFGTNRTECFTPLVGRHNVSNCLAAASAALHFGLSLEQIALGLETLTFVPGRLERVDCGQPFQVYVDFAHTDDALRRAISAVRTVTAGKVIIVFGAGGDRDKVKRPLMGRAAALADEAIITSDNPRSEDPYHIVDQILSGFSGMGLEPTVLIDRKEAIQAAIRRAQPGDAVIVAGKGHEREQILGDRRIPFDDAAVCREALALPAPHLARRFATAPVT
jgi:UDP-N-acetylmuramoyl-L-alanyl-D-glutamate--2,6-diaminopimelate ligase